ncbi:PAS domain-containing protein [Ekhidna sp.]
MSSPYPSLGLFKRGISTLEDKVTNERIVLSNIIYITVVVVTAIGYLLDYEIFLQPASEIAFDQFSSMILMAVAIGCFFLNSSRHFYASKVLFCTSWLLLSFYLNPFIQGTSSDYYFHYDAAILFISVLVQILFSTSKEPITYSIFTFLTFFTIVFHQEYLLYFSDETVISQLIAEDRYIRLIPVYYWFLFNLVVAYVITVYERSHKEVKVKNNAFKELNENLEMLVDERTEKLIKHQKELEEASAQLKESQKQYHDFIHNSYEGVARFEMTNPMRIDLDKKKQIDFLLENQFIAECNDSFARMYGFVNSEDIVGKKLKDLWDESPEREALLNKYIDNGYRFENFQTLEQTRQGEMKWFLNFGKSDIVDKHLKMLWVTQIDITQQVKMTAEKEKLLKDLEEYAFITSHEIRRPLSNLMGIATVISEKASVEDTDRMIVYLKESADELDGLIRKMSDTLSRTSYDEKK